MKCLKCGSENVKVGVKVFMYIDKNDAHKLTKKVIQKKSTEMWSANWGEARIVCSDCGYSHVGC